MFRVKKIGGSGRDVHTSEDTASTQRTTATMCLEAPCRERDRSVSAVEVRGRTWPLLRGVQVHLDLESHRRGLTPLQSPGTPSLLHWIVLFICALHIDRCPLFAGLERSRSTERPSDDAFMGNGSKSFRTRKRQELSPSMLTRHLSSTPPRQAHAVITCSTRLFYMVPLRQRSEDP